MQAHLQQRFNQFRDIVYLFVNTTLFVVEDNLIPDDYIDRTLAPDAVSRSYDQVLLGGVLFDCPDKMVCEISWWLSLALFVKALRTGKASEFICHTSSV